MYKIGNSIDIHKLVKGKDLYIGGIKIDSPLGSESFSDGDALIHCVVESILGALNKKDLGENYPNNDNKYKDIRSTYFIDDVKKKLTEEKYHISNIDIMIVLESPKLSSYKDKVKNNLAKLLDIDVSKISLKAGTNEKIGSIGNKESYLVWSSCLIEED